MSSRLIRGTPYCARGYGRKPGSGTIDVRTVTTAPGAAGAAPAQESGGEHEQARTRIQIAGLARGEGGGVRGEDLRPARMIKSEPARVRLIHRPSVVAGPAGPSPQRGRRPGWSITRAWPPARLLDTRRQVARAWRDVIAGGAGRADRPAARHPPAGPAGGPARGR